MLNKIKSYLRKFTGVAKAKINGMRQPIKWLIWCYFILVVLLVLTYYGTWLWFLYTGKAELNDLLSIIQEMMGGAAVAFVSFIGGCFVDLNGNGVPDNFEKEKEEDV